MLSAHSVPACSAARSLSVAANAGDVVVQPEQAVAQGEPERDPARLPAGAAQVQPPGSRAEGPLQLPLPAVVGVPVQRVVAELARRRVEQAEQPAAQRRRLAGLQRAAFGQRDQVGQVGEGEAAVQQRGVADLQRVAGLDQFGRWPAGDPGAGAEVALGRRYPVTRAPPAPVRRNSGPANSGPANRVGAPPPTRNTWVPLTRPARHSAISAAIALAPNVRVEEHALGRRDQPRRVLALGARDAVPRPDPAVQHVRLPAAHRARRPARLARARSVRRQCRGRSPATAPARAHSAAGRLTVTPRTR